MMNAVRRILSPIVLPLLLLFPLGCSFITPHENFKNGLIANIGYRIDEIQPGWASANQLVSSSLLPSGHFEYRYEYRLRKHGLCSYFYEVDPLTEKILGARFEGGEEDCVIFP